MKLSPKQIKLLHVIPRKLGPAGAPLKLLAKELEGGDGRAALRAARALQMLGAKARPVLPAMKRALQAARKGKGDSAMFIRFSLDPAVKKLASEP